MNYFKTSKSMVESMNKVITDNPDISVTWLQQMTYADGIVVHLAPQIETNGIRVVRVAKYGDNLHLGVECSIPNLIPALDMKLMALQARMNNAKVVPSLVLEEIE